MKKEKETALNTIEFTIKISICHCIAKEYW